MNVKGLKSGFLAGIVLFSTFFTVELAFMGIFGAGSDDETVTNTTGGAPVTSAINERVMLDGSSQALKYMANKTVSVATTTATSNITLPAITSTSNLIGVNGTLEFNWTGFDVNHTIENTRAADYPLAYSGLLNTTINTLTGIDTVALNEGTSATLENNLNFGTFSAPWQVNSAGNRVNVSLGFTITNITYPNSIRICLDTKMQFTKNVTMQVYAYDHHNNNGWVNINDVPEHIETTAAPVTKFYKFTDPHSQSIKSGTPIYLNITIVFNASESFRADLYRIKARVDMVREQNIAANNWLGLSFDLRGTATVKGFWMWIRSIDLNRNETLYLQLFKNNNSAITLEQIWSTANGYFLQQPNLAQPIAGTAMSIHNYTKDGVEFFSLPSPVTLPAGNYFIVINSSENKPVSGKGRYTLPVIVWSGDLAWPPDGDPDLRDDHTVAVTTNAGSTWQEVTYTISSDAREVDAGPFIVQLERGLVPGDLAMNISDYVIKQYRMSTTSAFSATNYEWGRGNWSYSAMSLPSAGAAFDLDFNWNSTKMPDFLYNGTFHMLVQANETTTVTCTLSTEDPAWSVAYDFNRTKYAGWTGRYLNFTVPWDWTPVNLTYPDGTNHYHPTNFKILNADTKQYKVNESSILSINSAYQQGVYRFNLKSPNYAERASTYLKYGTSNFYESTHFQTGDNISARMWVQDSREKAVLNGQVNFTAFSPSGSVAFDAASTTINTTAGFMTAYHFGDTGMHQFASGDPAGKYPAWCYWFNGSEAGILFPDVFKIAYTVLEYSAEELATDTQDRVFGSFKTGANESVPTDIFHASIDKYQKIPVGLTLEETAAQNVWFVSFNQSETVYNPGETIAFSVGLESRDLIFSHDVKVIEDQRRVGRIVGIGWQQPE